MSNLTSTDFLKTASQTAEYFGFRSIDTLKKDKACRNCERNLKDNSSANDRKTDSLFGLLTGGATAFCEAKLHGLKGPVLFYTHEQVPRTGESAFSFHIFNVEKSISEAILIHTIKALMDDLGYHKNFIRINSLGDRDSSTRYTRELTNYLKKRLDLMPPTARELMKEHPINSLLHLLEKEHELGYKSPNPMEYLSDQSRKHFREIIEYLDMSDTSYEIDPKMIGHQDCYSEAMFSVELPEDSYPEDEAPITVRGGRYDHFIKSKTDLKTNAAGAVVVLKNSKAPQRSPRIKLDNPSTYVVQLGFGPKVRSLMLIDTLRKANISVLQDLANDSLSDQLRTAEASGVKHTIIIGQKEFVEDTVILRDMHARNQEHIPIDQVVRRLKRSAAVKA
ncbi:hypothetical protein KC723_01400 [Candidatus Kaiserbacteria bacterium]|nr:hypothetical protein [Candidatus Kaiserbacteria bacterium]